MDYAYLAARHKALGDEVVVGGPETIADLYYLHHYLVSMDYENEAVKYLPQEKIVRVGALAGRHASSPFFNIYPAWEFFDYRHFSYYPALKVKPVLPVIASEGCKYKCSYCPYRPFARTWTPRPIQDVFDELFVDKHKYGARGIAFRDPLFSGNIRRTKELCEKIEPLGLQWACETRLESIDKETICAMEWAGCKSIHFGIESANKKVLAGVHRTTPTPEEMKDKISYTQKLGMKVICFFMFGLPLDTRETCEETIKLSTYLDPNFAEFFVCTPYPRTPLYAQVRNRLLTHDYSFFDGHTPVFRHDNMTSEELLDLHEKAYREFYLRTGWMWRFARTP
jgi:radical SAM superfamily enzyme YgiQ (UPF0313 family)